MTELVPGYEYPEEIRELFSEYTNMLIENDPSFAKYLEIQNYDAELSDLTVKYGLPDGRLYIARTDGQTSGCIALKKIDDFNCEMKRLYVRPAYRKQGIASLLAGRVIDDAKKAGYKYMLLDTLPFLEGALRLYKKYGFYEIPCYNDSPMVDSIYMKLDL